MDFHANSMTFIDFRGPWASLRVPQDDPEEECEEPVESLEPVDDSASESFWPAGATDIYTAWHDIAREGTAMKLINGSSIGVVTSPKWWLESKGSGVFRSLVSFDDVASCSTLASPRDMNLKGKKEALKATPLGFRERSEPIGAPSLRFEESDIPH